MAAKAGTAYIDIEGDFSALNRQVASHFNRISKQASTSGKKIGRTFGVGMAAGVGATVVAGKQLFDFGKDAVNVASDVSESLNKNQVLFGKYAKGVEGFSKRSADAFGISRRSALEYTGTFGNLFKALGITDKQSAKYSKSLLKLAADMASFNNSTPEEALEAIRSGLVGETEPLRRFGVNMNDATLKAQALKMGLIKTTKDALTPQQKALAANALITKQTAKAHGDFARTSDGLANSQRRLKARWEDVKNTLGTALLPAVNNVTRSLLRIADDVQPKVERAVKDIAGIFGRKDLSLGEKIQQSWNSIKLEFGPLADQLRQGIDDAKVGDKFKDVIEDAAPLIAVGVRTVGLKSAEYWWEGFKAAPFWAKVGGGAWLATKLGIAGPALKGLMSWVTGGKGGGLLSKATPMPVFVVNQGFGGTPVPGGGKGVPAPVPTGKFGRIKPLLKAGGKLGAAAAAITFGVNLVDAKGNPIAATINTASDLTFGIVPRVDPQGGAKRNLSEFQKTLQGLSSSGNLAGLEQMRKEFDAFEKFDAPGGIKTAREEIERMIAATKLGKLGITVDIRTKEALEGAKKVQAALERMKDGSSRSVNSLKTNVRLNMRLIRRMFAGDSAAAREAISANFSSAISNIKRSMREGTISVKEGTKLIQTYMTRSLMNFGFSREQALNIARDPTRRTSYTGGPEEGTRGPGHQRGGYINLGAASGDSVHAMLERDEYVLNRKAVKKVGKAALDRLNFGIAPRFQKGGSVTGDTDFLPALLRALRALSASVGVPIFVQSGRRTREEQLALGPSTPGHPVAGPNGPHVRGVAADITPGYSVFGSRAGRFGLAFTVMPQEPWHIQLVDELTAAGVKAMAAGAPDIAGVKVSGPGSALRTIAQSAIDATQAGLQSLATDMYNAVIPGGGEAPVRAAGSGADLMRSIANQRGWNFRDWWEIDRRETGHGTNLVNPTSSARLRGQFLSNNWGRYGPGSDPAANPSMAQQIVAMADYIGDRYGNPTKALAFHNANNYYRSGGLIGRLLGLVTGGAAAKKKDAKVKNNTIANLKYHKKHKPKDHITKQMIRSLGQAGATDLMNTMTILEGNVDRFADWAQRANDITDTDALQTALNNKMADLVKVALGEGKTVDFSEAGLLSLFSPADQDTFIQQWLHQFASFNGGIQVDWLNQELGSLFGWRNALIDNILPEGSSVVDKLIKAAENAYKKLHAELVRLANDVARYESLREKAIRNRENVRDDLRTAKKNQEDDREELARERKKNKPSRRKIERLENSIDKRRNKIQRLTARESRLDAQILNYRNSIQTLKSQQKLARNEAKRLGGDDGSTVDSEVRDITSGHIGALKEARTDMKSSLVNVHGLGTITDKFYSWSAASNSPPLGTFGGTILNVQNEILGIARNPPRATAEEPASTETTAAEERTKELLSQLLKEANKRAAISEAQYEIFRSLPIVPFGGSFAEGGTVPGPVGAPRMILAHGGEQVLSNDNTGASGARVVINVAPGMEWLKQFIDVRVENQTRTQGRRGERQLPGRAGILR